MVSAAHYPAQCARAYRATESASDMDVDAFDTDFRSSGRGNLKVYEVEFESHSQADIEKMMKEDVDNISSIFGVSVRFRCPNYPHGVSTDTFIT